MKVCVVVRLTKGDALTRWRSFTAVSTVRRQFTVRTLGSRQCLHLARTKILQGATQMNLRRENSYWSRITPSRLRNLSQFDHVAPKRGAPRPEILAKGRIFFNTERSSRAGKIEAARYAVVSHRVAIEHMIQILDSWELPRMSVLISVTGSAKLTMEHSLQEFVRHGLASAARSTNAWVFTGGMDVGVMALTGAAMRPAVRRNEGTPCIGIAPYRKVMHREKLYRPPQSDACGLAPDAGGATAVSGAPAGAPAAAASERLQSVLSAAGTPGIPARFEQPALQEKEVIYAKRRKNTRESAAIDANHTHFFLVDNEKEEWGGEIDKRAELEADLAKKYRVPLVLLVLEGGPNTYETVLMAISQNSMVVLVKESKGAAQTISDFIEPLMSDRESLLRDPTLLAGRIADRSAEFQPVFLKYNRDMKESQQELCLDRLRRIAQRLDLLSIFSYSHSVATGQSFDIALLRAFVQSFKRKEKEDAERRSARVHKKALLAPLCGAPPPHRRARGPHPFLPPRFEVPDARVPWRTPFPSYDPKAFTAPVVLENDCDKVPEEAKPGRGWADPDFPRDEFGAPLPFPDSFVEQLKQRHTFELSGVIQLSADRVPLNPRGRTGLCERGLLGKWGPNHAADPIVTRYEPHSQRLQMVVIKRRDTGEWAIPGGMVDAGERVSQTVKREFMEEAVNLQTVAEKKRENQQLLDDLFKQERVVYQGYVDDPRNTDHAWIETTAYHFHCDKKVASLLTLEAGDDAQSVKWVNIAPDSDDYNNLYASHKDWVDLVERWMRPHHKCRDDDPATGYQDRQPVDNLDVPWSADLPTYEPPAASRAAEALHHWRSELEFLTTSQSAGYAHPKRSSLSGLTRFMPSFLSEDFSLSRMSRSLTGPSRAPPSALDASPGSSRCRSSTHGKLREASQSATATRGCSTTWHHRTSDTVSPRLNAVAEAAATPRSSAPRIARSESPGASRVAFQLRPRSTGDSASPEGRRSGESDRGAGNATRNSNADELVRRNSSGDFVALDRSHADTDRQLHHMYNLRYDSKEGRKTYEAPIQFTENWTTNGSRPLPLNPRGRTGLMGLGSLAQWGPNHMCECIITRFAPRSETGYMMGTSDGGDDDSFNFKLQPPNARTNRGSRASLRRGSRDTGASAAAAPNRDTNRFSTTPSCISEESSVRMTLSRRNSHHLPSPEQHSLVRSPSSARLGRQLDLSHDLEVLVLPYGKDHRYRGLDMTRSLFEPAPLTLPCFFTPEEPGCHVPAEVRAALFNEAHQHSGEETWDRLQHLLQEAFDGHTAQHMYQGYVDDARNTDNAWIETTVHHMHLPRELGNQLPFAASHRDLLEGGLVWVPLRKVLSASPVRPVDATENKWLEQVHSRVAAEYTRPGLLQLVVRWGRNDIAKIVLHDPELTEQRAPVAVQRAFQEALERSVDRSFDIGLVETLLDHGAEAAGISISSLFYQVQNDSFGYCSDLKAGRYDTMKASRMRRARVWLESQIRGMLRLPARSAGSEHLIAVGPLSENSHRGHDGTHAAVRRRLSYCSSASGSAKTLPSGSAKDLLALQTASVVSDQHEQDGLPVQHSLEPSHGPAGQTAARWRVSKSERAKLMTPWSEPQLNLMTSFIGGFADYGRSQPVARYFDIMCWAIIAGSLELAHVMWQRTQSPLLAGLVAEFVCKKIKKAKHIGEEELDAAAKRFSKDTVGVLNYINDDEEARKILTTPRHDSGGGTGLAGSNGEVLDLAIHLEMRTFVAHRHCMNVMKEQLNGRLKRAGAMKMHTHPLRFELNDLAPGYAKLQVSSAPRSPVLPSWWIPLELWRIPRIKRYTHMTGMVLFVMAYCIVALQPLCGPLNNAHYIFASWLTTMAVQEVHQIIRVGWRVYTAPGLDRVWNVIDVIFITMMTCAAFLRVCSSDLDPFHDQHFGDKEHTHTSLVGWLRHHTMEEPYPSGYGPRMRRSLHEVNASLPPLHGLSADECEFTLLIDALRSLLGITAIPLFVRLFELVTFDDRLGVLLVCLTRMMRDLMNWMVLITILSLGFAVAFSILTPNFHQGSELQLADSAGPLRPLSFADVVIDFSAGGAFFLPFWALYGFFEPGELAAAPGASSFTPAVLWLYLTIAVVIFVNLLIAMLNSRYDAVLKKANEQWRMAHVHQIKAYINQYPAPPPFNVLCILLQCAMAASMGAWCYFRPCCRAEPESRHENDANEFTRLELERMERQAMDFYLEAQKKEQGGGISGRLVPGALDENAMSKLERIYEYVEKNMTQGKGPTHLRDVRGNRLPGSCAASTPKSQSSHGMDATSKSTGALPSTRMACTHRSNRNRVRYYLAAPTRPNLAQQRLMAPAVDGPHPFPSIRKVRLEASIKDPRSRRRRHPRRAMISPRPMSAWDSRRHTQSVSASELQQIRQQLGSLTALMEKHFQLAAPEAAAPTLYRNCATPRSTCHASRCSHGDCYHDTEALSIEARREPLLI